MVKKGIVTFPQSGCLSKEVMKTTSTLPFGS